MILIKNYLEIEEVHLQVVLVDSAIGKQQTFICCMLFLKDADCQLPLNYHKNRSKKNKEANYPHPHLSSPSISRQSQIWMISCLILLATLCYCAGLLFSRSWPVVGPSTPPSPPPLVLVCYLDEIRQTDIQRSRRTNTANR